MPTTLTRIFTFIICNFVFVSITFAQVHPCGTDLLNHHKKDYELPTVNAGNITTRSSFSIPVAMHIIRSDHSFRNHFYACEPTADSKLVYDDLAAANELFKPHGIQFSMCGEINFIRSNELNIMDMESEDEMDKLNSYNITNVINIYYVHSINFGEWRYAGYAYFPWYTSNHHIVMSRSSIQISGNTLAHELGHALGIYHPHTTLFGRELVDGSNCQEAGDLICDTPADPNLYDKVTSSCRYTKFELDSIGMPYVPNTQLIMSYSLKSCRNSFSPQQVEKMKESYELYYKD